jgi:nucleoside-diphosphate-sugar epimerase
MKNNVLIVGGTGYIGKELSQFISDEYDVYITGTKFYKKSNYFQLDLSLPKTFESIKNLHFELILFLASSIKGLGDTSLINSDLRINTVEVGAFLDFIKKYNISKKIISS